MPRGCGVPYTAYIRTVVRASSRNGAKFNFRAAAGEMTTYLPIPAVPYRLRVTLASGSGASGFRERGNLHVGVLEC